MKLTFLIITGLMSFASFAKDVKDFNKVLIETIQHDLQNDNDHSLKTKVTPMRGPASVEGVGRESAGENFEKKNVRQTGMEKW